MGVHVERFHQRVSDVHKRATITSNGEEIKEEVLEKNGSSDSEAKDTEEVSEFDLKSSFEVNVALFCLSSSISPTNKRGKGRKRRLPLH
jgi:hypothetical protein